MDLAAELVFAMELVDVAAETSLRRFESGDFAVEAKPDGSPVADVDRAVDAAIRARITRRDRDQIVSEEYGRSGRARDGWCWYLDPIDGTTRFLAGDPQWTTLVELAYRNQVVLGIVDVPAMHQRWWASRGKQTIARGPATRGRAG